MLLLTIVDEGKIGRMINDYINLVVLGNFNPSILTHNFLTAVCGFDLGSKPTEKNLPLPVVASLSYGEISFFADLGRLQITEKNCRNPKKSKLPTYLKTYLNKLPHTPITKCGANFNCNIEVREKKLKDIEQKLQKDRQYFCKALDVAEIQLEVIFDINDKAETVKRWILRTTAQSGESSTTMNLQRLEDLKIKIDFNYEINLEQNRDEGIRKITDDYAKIYDLYLFQFRKLFEENKS
jgi:hypothetical protein